MPIFSDPQEKVIDMAKRDDISKKEILTGVSQKVDKTYADRYKETDLHLSRKSCKVSDIIKFVYGPFTSRFWIMRKHFNLMSQYDLGYNIPFFAWDCITITTKDKGDLYLIIRDEEQM